MEPFFTDREIVAARPPKEPVDSRRPYAYLIERERTAAGRVEDVATLFLTNRECPFRCLMCDLWKHTTDAPVAGGDIPAQIDFALSRLPTARHVKLYNSGNFFDAKAIPPKDHPAIARRIQQFETVIVENHPRLCNERCAAFADRIAGRLEIALGLETAHPVALKHLNKRMTRDDFRRAAELLTTAGIAVRTFILLRPPYLSEEEGIEWALRSLEFAFDAGASCCSVIPTRSGNGIMDELERAGLFHPPSLASLETVLARGIAIGRGRVFADLWDLERFYDCPRCGPERRTRLEQMNYRQEVLPPVACSCGTGRTDAAASECSPRRGENGPSNRTAKRAGAG